MSFQLLAFIINEYNNIRLVLIEAKHLPSLRSDDDVIT
jgi:hypothetical protein